MSTSTARRAQRVLIDFSSGPVHCRSCGAAMRPAESITNGWPASTTPYGRAGECKSCAAPSPSEVTSTGETDSVVEPAQPPAAPTPRAVPRRRPHRRFSYRPPQEDFCFSCGRPINPLTGECRCSS